jgi:hypothetical protein
MARRVRNHRSQQPPTLVLGNKQVLSRPSEGASGAGTTSSGRTSRTRHATAAHHRPRHLRTNPCPHRTTCATLRPSTLPRANVAAGQSRIDQNFPRDSCSLTTAISAARKLAYVATWTTSRSTERAVIYCYLYEKQRETA